MSITLKLHKEIENNIHEQLYANILLLTFNYSASKDFNAYFKKDMFVKNNKAAFQHVVHFLVSISDPNYFKLRSVWPILDVKMEIQFRNEVMKFINELNLSNKETGIPLIMTSQLISPGGCKFAEFVFKLSQFVLSEHIKKDPNYTNLLLPPAVNNDYHISSQQVNNLNKIVDDQYVNLAQMQEKFHCKYEETKTRINNILQQKPILEQDAKIAKANIDEFNKDSENIIAKVCGRKIEDEDKFFNEKITNLCTDKEVLEKCSLLIDILNENKNIVQQSSTRNIDSIQTYKHKNHTDLLQHFKTLLATVKSNKYILKNRKDFSLLEYVATTAEIANSLKGYAAKYEELLNEFSAFKMQLENNYPENFDRDIELSPKMLDIFSSLPKMRF